MMQAAEGQSSVLIIFFMHNKDNLIYMLYCREGRAHGYD